MTSLTAEGDMKIDASHAAFVDERACVPLNEEY